MIERMANQNERTARRKGVVPSANLRPHFLALARQITRWSAVKTGRPVTVGVTSLDSRVGRSTISFNLASALTSVARDRVVLIESDFGKHYISRRLGHAHAAGLSELILGFDQQEDVILDSPLNGLAVLGCGKKSAQESLELPFDLLHNVVAEKFADYGFAIFDLPVANHLTACFSIASQLDGVVLVVEANQIHQRQISRFKKQMGTLGVEIIGLVINKS